MAVAPAHSENPCGFETVSAFLQHFVIGLGGRPLGVATHRKVHTDTERIYLPEQIGEFAERDRNAALYKLIAAHLWAQARYGTWRRAAVEALSPWTSSPPVMAVFNALECVRLDACMARDLPGLARQMDALGYRSENHRREWQALVGELPALTRPGATALDSIGLVETWLGRTLPAPKHYQAEMDLIAVNQAMKTRIEREKEAVQQALGGLERALRQTIRSEGKAIADEGRFTLLDEQDAAGRNLDLYYDGQRVEMTPDIQVLMESIRQDLGEVPRQYLDGVAGLPFASDLEADLGEEGLVADADDLGPGVIRYREWDYVRQRFREDYCLMRESEVPPIADDFVAQTLEKYQGLLKSIKRTFAAMVGESKLLRRQNQGDDIDIDALIEAQADFVNGQELSDYIYTRYR